ncbi:hypothetical protein Tco_0336941 [Tanacetum coccineum]
MKAITIRSGVAYKGPSIPTNPSHKKVVDRETEETTDKEQTNFQGSTAHIPLPVTPIPISEPDVPKTLPKPNIPYPSRRNDQKFREKTLNQMEKIFHIFQDLRFDISFADALLLMPRFAPTIKRRSFFRTGRALIDVYEGELILRDGDERLIFHVDKHPQKHANESIKMINFIDVSCKDSFGEVLKLKKSNHFSSGSTTPLSDSRPSLTSFETSDSLLEEFADELALLDPFPPGNEDVDFEADLREIELLLNRDPSTNFSPTITIDPNPERFINEPALACLPPPGDDESFLKEDVQEENFQVYSNPLFEFDDNYNSSDINPLFNEILEDVERKDSNVSNFDEPVLLNTPLFDEDECFDPGGEIDKIDAFMDAYNDSEGDVLEILHNTTHNLFPEVFFDHEPQGLKDEPDNDNLMTEDKVFDPGVMEKFFSPSYVRLSSKDRHYLFFTIVIQILLTHPVNFLFSFGSEDTIFDPGIFAYIFYSYKPVSSHRDGTFMCVKSKVCDWYWKRKDVTQGDWVEMVVGIDDDDFDEEEGEIDIDIFQIEDEILREKLLNVNLLIDKIEALNLTPSIPFVLEYPSSSPISVVDSDFLIQEGEGELDVSQILKMTIPCIVQSGTFLSFLTYLLDSPYFSPLE